MMTVDQTLLRAPIDRIKLDTPFYSGIVEAKSMKDPLFDLIVGNVPGAKKPNDPNPEWGLMTTVVTYFDEKKRYFFYQSFFFFLNSFS